MVNEVMFVMTSMACTVLVVCCFVNLILARLVWEEGTSAEKNPSIKSFPAHKINHISLLLFFFYRLVPFPLLSSIELQLKLHFRDS